MGLLSIATPIPEPTAPRELYFQRAVEMVPNTVSSDITGHPAVSVPCGTSGGLPIGMMLVGRHFEDARVLQVARLYEEQVGGFEALLGTPPRQAGRAAGDTAAD